MIRLIILLLGARPLRASGCFLRYLALAPAAIGATLVNSALETAGTSFLPFHAMRVGWGEQPATLPLSVLLLSVILLQLPVGCLGDRMDRCRLVIGLGIAPTLGALVWPFVSGMPLLAYPLLFLWGSVFVGIYTVMTAIVGSCFAGGNLVSVYAVMSIAWGASGRLCRACCGGNGDEPNAAWITDLHCRRLRGIHDLRNRPAPRCGMIEANAS